MEYKEYTVEDLNTKDFELLRQAYFAQQNNPKILFCFGKSYSKLNKLKLIDNENLLTFEGKNFVKYYISRFEEKFDV